MTSVSNIDNEHALHLKSVVEKHYKLSTDWSGARYIRLSLDWDYACRNVHLSLPGYVARAQKQFGHHKPTTSQPAPF
jgi:hypothetical protein